MRDVGRVAFDSYCDPIWFKFDFDDGGNFKIGWYWRRLNEDSDGIQWLLPLIDRLILIQEHLSIFNLFQAHEYIIK